MTQLGGTSHQCSQGGLPARVASIEAGVGSAASGTVLTLAEGGLRLTASLDPVNGLLVKPGMGASRWLQGDSSLQARAAKVTSVGQMAVNSSSGLAYPVTLDGVAPLPMSWAGHNVVVSIRVNSTGGPVLAVPQAATSSTADGATHIVTYQAGRQKVVPVSAGASAGGLSGATARTRRSASGSAGSFVGYYPLAWARLRSTLTSSPTALNVSFTL